MTYSPHPQERNVMHENEWWDFFACAEISMNMKLTQAEKYISVIFTTRMNTVTQSVNSHNGSRFIQ